MKNTTHDTGSGVVYWCTMRLWVAGTTGIHENTIAPELTLDEAIRRWEHV